MNDRRKKGCPNEHCIQHINKVKNNAEIDYCPKCGSKLIFVCEKCFSQIEDIDLRHRICIRCKTEAEEKREKAIEKGNEIAKKYLVMPVVGIVAGIVVNVQKDAIKKGTEFAKNIVDNLGKK